MGAVFLRGFRQSEVSERAVQESRLVVGDPDFPNQIVLTDFRCRGGGANRNRTRAFCAHWIFRSFKKGFQAVPSPNFWLENRGELERAINFCHERLGVNERCAVNVSRKNLSSASALHQSVPGSSRRRAGHDHEFRTPDPAPRPREPHPKVFPPTQLCPRARLSSNSCRHSDKHKKRPQDSRSECREWRAVQPQSGRAAGGTRRAWLAPNPAVRAKPPRPRAGQTKWGLRWNGSGASTCWRLISANPGRTPRATPSLHTSWRATR